MKHIYDAISDNLKRGVEKSGKYAVKTSEVFHKVKENTPTFIDELKDAYEKGRQDEIRRMDLETIHPDGSSKEGHDGRQAATMSEEPEQMDLFDDLPEPKSSIRAEYENWKSNQSGNNNG